MGRFKKYVRKQARRAGGWAKKRYAPGGKVNFGRIVKDVAILKNAINVEHKYFDKIHDTDAYAGNSYVYPLMADISQGTGQSQRVGASLKLNAFQMMGRFDRAVTTGSVGPNSVRVMLVQDKEPLTGALTNANLGTTLLAANGTQAFRNFNYEQSSRFRVLMDRVYVIDGIKTGTVNLKYYRKMEMRVKYDANTTTVLDNNLYLIVICDGATTELPARIYTRLKYVDN